ncbi:MAG: 4-hydroxythreonine-4-phosphate dehydrogenase PdxA [Candidatus Omnitrophica bacterium]|nr:4-hydroxythreonine-4-phosphate dehydrogenase PdxA [Candidatus Omnitrophota bacterium]
MNYVKSLIFRSGKIRVGITLGDPAGIGPQILSDAFRQIGKLKGVEFIVIGDRKVLNKFNFPYNKVTFLDLDNVSLKEFSFGKINPHYGRAAVEYIDKAIELIKNKEIDCLVTLPITKTSVSKGGFCWPGHTEYLAEIFGVKGVVMMLMNRYVRVSLVTRHLAIKDVASELTKEKIYNTIILTYEGLKNWFGIRRPKIAVCALNPHASDGGMFGNEEEKLIIPAINEVRNKIKDITIFGPLASDALFFKAKERIYNAIIAMYHDQAMIALKLLDFFHGVNITLGLPFVRTSPLHGSALDMAGKRKASCLPLIEAIQSAIRCTLYKRRGSF